MARVETKDLCRENLASNTVKVLRRGRRAKPDVLLVRRGAGFAVVKDFSARAWWVRATVGRLLISREFAAYRALAAHPEVPRCRGLLDPLALVIEYRPGEPMSPSLGKVVPRGFLAALRQSVERMHGLGVVHLDLGHRSNVLAGSDGRPVIIDFATALRVPGWATGWLLPCATWIDRRAVRKWEKQLGDPGGS